MQVSSPVLRRGVEWRTGASPASSSAPWLAGGGDGDSDGSGDGDGDGDDDDGDGDDGDGDGDGVGGGAWSCAKMALRCSCGRVVFLVLMLLMWLLRWLTLCCWCRWLLLGDVAGPLKWRNNLKIQK